MAEELALPAKTGAELPAATAEVDVTTRDTAEEVYLEKAGLTNS
jgi:hypothetical protein